MDNILAGHTNSYHSYSFDEALEGIANAGFEYVELSAVGGWTEHVPLDASEAQISHVQAKFDKYGLRPSVLSGHSDLTTAAGLETAKKATDLCQKLGLSILNTAIGGHYKEGEDKDAFMNHIHDLADYCADRSITIGLEVHGEIMATGRSSIDVIEEIGRDNVRINYDTANCEFYGGVKAVDELREVVPYLCHVHLKDKVGGKGEWNFPGIGEGHVDFEQVLTILDKEGYDGPFSVEIEFQGEPWPPVEEVHRSMKVSYDTLTSLGLS